MIHDPKPGQVWEFDGGITVLILRRNKTLNVMYGDNHFDVVYLRVEHFPEDAGLTDWVNFAEENSDSWVQLT